MSGPVVRKLTATLILAVATLVALALPEAQAAADRRVALVIGNGAYRNVATLENPAIDARGLSASLRRLGFEVVEGYDETLDGMRKTVSDFSTKLDGATVALVYYAGHGVSVAGENYLLPVDTVLKSESDLDFRTLNVNLILRQMQREDRVNIVILDACRDNPFKAELSRSMKTRSAVIAEGLTEISAKSAAGTLIAFATDPGMTALDGAKGENSPFAAALLKHIETPNLPISSVLDRVRESVWNATNRKQRPWMNTSIIGEFYLSGGPAAAGDGVKQASLSATAPVTMAGQAANPAQTLEMKLWDSAERSDAVEDYKAYLDAYPQGTFAGLARNRIARAARGTTAKAAPTVTDEQLKGEVGTATTERQIGWSPAERQEAQKRLAALGFKPGKVSGEIRPETRAAFAEWQKSRSIAETGYLTKVQKTALWEQSQEVYEKALAAAPAAAPSRKAAVQRTVREPRRREASDEAPTQALAPRPVRQAPVAAAPQPQPQRPAPSLGDVGSFLGGVGGVIGAVRRY